jgi:hypothetical protein
VAIPDSVTTISNAAFAWNRLSSVVIPNSVTTIGKRAFADNQLTSVVILSSVTEIGEGAFERNQLTSITIPDGLNISYVVFGDPLFEGFYHGFGGGAYVLQGGEWTLNGAKIVYSELIPGDGIYISAIDGKRIGEDIVSSVDVMMIASKVEDLIKRLRERQGERQILKPGWHDIEVGYSDSCIYSKGTVTFKQRYLFEDGKYSITGKPEGDQIIFTIKRRD